MYFAMGNESGLPECPSLERDWGIRGHMTCVGLGADSEMGCPKEWPPLRLACFETGWLTSRRGSRGSSLSNGRIDHRYSVWVRKRLILGRARCDPRTIATTRDTRRSAVGASLQSGP